MQLNYSLFRPVLSKKALCRYLPRNSIGRMSALQGHSKGKPVISLPVTHQWQVAYLVKIPNKVERLSTVDQHPGTTAERSEDFISPAANYVLWSAHTSHGATLTSPSTDKLLPCYLIFFCFKIISAYLSPHYGNT